MSVRAPFVFGGAQDNDAILLAAEREWLDGSRQCAAESRRGGQVDGTDLGRNRETGGNNIQHAPSSLTGAAVKLRMAIHPELGIEEGGSSEIVIALRQVLTLIEREIGLTGPRSAPRN